MKKIQNLLWFLTFMLLSSGLLAQSMSTITPEQVGFSSERLGRLDQTLQQYVDQSWMSGGVVLVMRDGQPFYYKSFGMRDVESADPMQVDDLFRIASQTKALVSVGIMILQEQGKLLLNDPVGKYLPEFLKTKVAEPDGKGGYRSVEAKRPITIRDLLTHTAGISYGIADHPEWVKAGIQGWYFADREEPIRETIRRLASLPFNAQPGERYVYGYSTDILGVVIEAITKQSLEQFLQTEILTPLKMKDTHFYVPSEKVDRLTTVYSRINGGKIVRAADPGGSVGQGHYVKGPRKSFSGGAGLISTANDYARFLQMLLNGGTLEGVRILSPVSVELMRSHQTGAIMIRPGVGMGLGFDVIMDIGANGVPSAIGDFGWGGAYHSTYWVSPKDRLVVVFFTQLIPAQGSDLHGKLRTLIYQAKLN